MTLELILRVTSLLTVKKNGDFCAQTPLKFDIVDRLYRGRGVIFKQCEVQFVHQEMTQTIFTTAAFSKLGQISDNLLVQTSNDQF